MNADHVFSQDKIIASLRLELQGNDKVIEALKRKVKAINNMYDAEKRRADLLQAEISIIDDFYIEALEEIGVKLERRKH